MQIILRLVGFIVFVACSSTAILAYDQARLVPNSPIRGRMTCPNESPSFQMSLRRNQVAEISISHSEILLQIAVRAPSKAESISLWFPGKYHGEDRLALVATESGSYTLELRCAEDWNMGVDTFIADGIGEYIVALNSVRDSTTADRTHFEADRLFYAAVRDGLRRNAYAKAEADIMAAQSTYRIMGDSPKAALTYHALGLLQYGQTKNLKAEALLSTALAQSPSKTAAAATDPSLMLHLGMVNSSMHRYEPSLRFYGYALTAAEQTGDRMARGCALFWIGLVRVRAGQRSEAIDAYHMATAAFQSIRSYRWYVKTQLYRAGTESFLGRRQAGFSLLDDALKVSAGESYLGPERVEVLLTLGGWYGVNGEYDRQLQTYMSALDFATSARLTNSEYSIMISLAAFYGSGDPKAIDFFSRALTLARQSNDRTRQSRALRFICQTYQQLGELQLAFQFCGQARHIAGVSFLDAAFAESTLGRLHALRGDYNNALTLSRAALTKLKVDGNRFAEAEIQLQIGDMCQTAKRNDDMLAYQAALTIADQIGSKPLRARCLFSLASAHARRNEVSKAEQCLKQALSMSETVTDIGRTVWALSALAGLAKRLNHLDDARKHLDNAIQLVESTRARVTIPILQTAFASNMRFVYDLYIDVLMANPQEGSAKALEISERARARTFLESLRPEVAERVRLPRDLARQRDTLSSDLAAKYREELSSLVNGDGSHLQALRQDIAVGSAKRDQLNSQLRHSSEVNSRRPVSVSGLQALLGPDDVLLEYALTTQSAYLWMVTRESVKAWPLGSRDGLEHLVTSFRAAISLGRPSQVSQFISKAVRTAALRDASAPLTKLLLDPVLPLIRGKRVIIAPDGPLHYLPFGALDIKKADGTIVPWINDNEITIIPSGSAISYVRSAVRNRPSSPSGVALIGDPVFSASDPRVSSVATSRPVLAAHSPAVMRSLEELRLERSGKQTGNGDRGFTRLPFTRSEIDGISEVFHGKDVITLMDFKANITALVDHQLDDYQILHFATHGLLNSQEPELSGLVLSLFDQQGRPQHGFLTLNDIVTLSVTADLVVLSACETALGREIRGEGIAGLTEAFMSAGATSVVSTLWRVDDLATRELMVKLYRHLRQAGTIRGSVGAALRAAQMEMSKQPSWADPYYWAGFVVNGDWQ